MRLHRLRRRRRSANESIVLLSITISVLIGLLAFFTAAIVSEQVIAYFAGANAAVVIVSVLLGLAAGIMVGRWLFKAELRRFGL